MSLLNNFELEQVMFHDTKISETYQRKDNETEIQTYYAKYTRPIMSLFEYVQTITTLANYLQNQKSLSEFVDVVELNNFVNPSFLAFQLLDTGKWDAVLIRNGNEKVTFSTLKQDPRWRTQILELIEKKNETLNDELKSLIE